MSGPGYVYIIAADEPCKGMYKIGKANKPDSRIRALTLTMQDLIEYVSKRGQ